MQEKEVWKSIDGFENIYEVSNKGRVKSLARVTKNRRNGKVFNWHQKEKILKTYLDGKDYECIDFHKKGKKYKFKVHRLVIESFSGKSDLQVNHKNLIKTDNRLENLEYCTNQENQIHSYINNMGGTAKLKYEDIPKIWELWNSGNYSQESIGKMFNVTGSNINKIIIGATWSYARPEKFNS